MTRSRSMAGIANTGFGDEIAEGPSVLNARNCRQGICKGKSFPFERLLAGGELFLHGHSDFRGEGYVLLCRHKRIFTIFGKDCILIRIRGNFMPAAYCWKSSINWLDVSIASFIFFIRPSISTLRLENSERREPMASAFKLCFRNRTLS